MSIKCHTNLYALRFLYVALCVRGGIQWDFFHNKVAFCVQSVCFHSAFGSRFDQEGFRIVMYGNRNFHMIQRCFNTEDAKGHIVDTHTHT